MIERDYILRLIQQLTEALARVQVKKDLKQYNGAILEIEATSERLIGMKWNVLRTFSDVQLIDLFGFEDTLAKMLAAAELLREESDILGERGNADESLLQGMKAFSLYTELILKEESFLKTGLAEKVTVLLQRLEEYELPRPLEYKRFRFKELTREYATAEDILLDLIDQDSTLIPEGISFYRRLLKRPEDDLAAGNLSSESIRKRLFSLEFQLEGHT